MSPKTIVAIRKRLWNRQNKRCGYCGKYIPFSKSTADHIIPLNRKIIHNVELRVLSQEANLLVSCTDCNRLKTNLSLAQFRQLLVYENAISKTNKVLDTDFKFYFETLSPMYSYKVHVQKGLDKQTLYVKAYNCKEVLQYCYKHFRTWDVISIEIQ